ncbi:LacI family DNA-binding transcriptional regulator [Faecalicatena contorta]|uniref:Ribose transport system substrate-binding protein n=1 Tax=Faecalicatena contorta TaxID=39482 RepID=A0A315ZXM8_9FIRM|nr:LacI family DNA-binding transcriptional regulator [Faecalicatena contorta]PWJ49648.1 ribose transport system substrate-binding protein [Faecalicatena contorta]SUQ14366.1 ribose transport system substrate-binding protein [Faecalicatena contorta]
MGTTIKDIAKTAGVSVATVSHVVNKTRYVSPELVKRVEDAINNSDYKIKIQKKVSSLKIGKQSQVAIVIPSLMGSLYVQLIEHISAFLREKGYIAAVYFSNGNYRQEKEILNRLMMDKKVAGIILSPCRMDSKNYEKLYARNIPVVLLERAISGKEEESVVAENTRALYKGTQHLIKNGHKKIGVILGDLTTSAVAERLEGYQRALRDAELDYTEKDVLSIVHEENIEEGIEKIRDFYNRRRPTAIISGGNRLTFLVLKALQHMGLECPQDISVVGFGDEEWCELVVPPLTAMRQDTRSMAYYAVERIAAKIENKDYEKGEIRVPLQISVRKSTQMIGGGPFGEKAFSPDDIALTEEEKRQLRQGNFKIGISFHYSGTAWKRLHEAGIRQTLEMLGVTVAAVTEANFDSELQVTQLEALAMQRLDAIIAIPADDNVTAGTFKKLSRETKLLFLSNVPAGFGTDDYVSCVSVNERENGRIVGTLLGEYYKGKKHVKVGFINHGLPFYGTHLRDGIAVQIICENYVNIEIASVEQFQNIEDAYEIVKNMLRRHPDIQGLYVSWDQPALRVIRALEELGREDVEIFTTDLDREIGNYLVKDKYVKGMSTQRPFEQGVAAAMAAAKALLGHNGYKYIGVSPYLVQKKNIVRAWKDIMHEPIPGEWNMYMEK